MDSTMDNFRRLVRSAAAAPSRLACPSRPRLRGQSGEKHVRKTGRDPAAVVRYRYQRGAFSCPSNAGNKGGAALSITSCVRSTLLSFNGCPSSSRASSSMLPTKAVVSRCDWLCTWAWDFGLGG